MGRFGYERLGEADLTWEEKNSADYLCKKGEKMTNEEIIRMAQGMTEQIENMQEVCGILIDDLKNIQGELVEREKLNGEVK